MTAEPPEKSSSPACNEGCGFHLAINIRATERYGLPFIF
jgi:hypothetical protein